MVISRPSKGPWVVLLDSEDAAWAKQFRWVVQTSAPKRVNSSTYRYEAIVRYEYAEGGKSCHFMARELLGTSVTQLADHINGNSLDNRKGNLRPANSSKNGQNRKGATALSKSGIRGVSWDKKRGVWVVRAKTPEGGKYAFGGRFESLDAAKEAAIALRLSIMPFTAQEKTV